MVGRKIPTTAVARGEDLHFLAMRSGAEAPCHGCRLHPCHTRRVGPPASAAHRYGRKLGGHFRNRMGGVNFVNLVHRLWPGRRRNWRVRAIAGIPSRNRLAGGQE